MWIKFNPNPKTDRGKDCVIRAICKLIGKDWMTVYLSICLQGAVMGEMPSVNKTWMTWLRGQGYKREAVPDLCPECYTVADFCKDHPEGDYLLMVPGHVVCASGGNYFDTWDSGNETVLFYWTRSESDGMDESVQPVSDKR